MKKQAILAILALLMLLGVGWVVVRKIGGERTAPNDTTAIATSTLATVTNVDEHLTIDETLRDVNFCGEIYKVKQVMIDGVDVVQRIAEIATKDLIPERVPKGPKLTPQEQTENMVIIRNGQMAKLICENVSRNVFLGETIKTEVGKKFNGVNAGIDEEMYPVSAEKAFYVAVPSGNIYTDDGFSGTFIGPIGKLK